MCDLSAVNIALIFQFVFQPYVYEAKEAFLKYRDDVKKFRSSLSDFELDQLGKERKAEKQMKKENRLKRNNKKVNCDFFYELH